MPQFAAATDLTLRFDWRWIARNVLDGSTATTSAPLPSQADLQNPSTTAGQVVATMLQDASDLVMGAAAIGGRYSESDVQTYGGNLLIQITCALAIGLLLRRRGRALTDEDALSKPYNEAMEYLEKLRAGERIFWAVPNVAQAGLPAVASMKPIQPPPVITKRAGRYFGSLINPYGSG